MSLFTIGRKVIMGRVNFLHLLILISFKPFGDSIILPSTMMNGGVLSSSSEINKVPASVFLHSPLLFVGLILSSFFDSSL